jgi:membrane-associated phospholipid phosphatase
MCGFAAVTSRFPGDLTAARHIQDFDDFGFGPLASFANSAGNGIWGPIITVAFAILFALRRRFPEAAIVVLTLIPRGLRQLLAVLVARSRPSADLLQVREHAPGYSFPSGHATGVMVLYGALFVLAAAPIPQRPVRMLFQGLCGFMIVVTGLSRVYIGVHWPSDVVGGFVFGLLCLAPLFLLYHLSADPLKRCDSESPGFIRRSIRRMTRWT